jgi:hypothetical protein
MQDGFHSIRRPVHQERATRDGRDRHVEHRRRARPADPGHPVELVGLVEQAAGVRPQDDVPVGEANSPDGREFMLHRNAPDVAKDGPDADTFYGALVARNGQDNQCTSRGFQSHGHCRHHNSIRTLLEAGHIDEPNADRTPDPRPTREQLDVTDPGYLLDSDLELLEPAAF